MRRRAVFYAGTAPDAQGAIVSVFQSVHIDLSFDAAVGLIIAQGQAAVAANMWRPEVLIRAPEDPACDPSPSRGPGGIHVMDASGKRLGRLRIPGHVTNMAWGEYHWRSLYK